MELKKITPNFFILSNPIYQVKLDLNNNNVAILKHGELQDYCKLVFRDHWSMSNYLIIVNQVTKETLFEVDLKGENVNDWINQLALKFAEYLEDPEVITGYYNISGLIIPEVL